MQDRIREFLNNWGKEINPPVFAGAGGLVIAFIVFGGIWTATARQVFDQVLSFISTNFGAYYVYLTLGVLLFVLALALSPAGKIRLGDQGEEPEFKRLPWLAMLFSAGMGMGLVFWGVAEPVMHYGDPPFAPANTPQAKQEAMRFAFFHWGFHPWAVYALFGLGIAYFHFRKKLPLAPRSMLYPIFGDKINGPIGHVADVICTVGTLLGVATSLGLGAMQINSGLSTLADVAYGTNNQLLVILVITAAAVTSTITGVGRGIKYLSMVNLGLMALLLAFVMVVGPFLKQMEWLGTAFWNNLRELPATSVWLDDKPGASWQTNWTIFYWGWWISWCPFVGIFIARISRGRTIREFILTVLILPALVTFLWFAVFGATAFHQLGNGNQGLAKVVARNESMALYELLGNLPLSEFSQWIALLLVVIFFITSSDSGSLVDDMVTSGGNPDPPAAQRAFWGIAEGSAGAVLILVGGLKALQSASISGGLIQSVLLVGCAVSLALALRKERW